MEDIFETKKSLDLQYDGENTYYLIMNEKDNKATIPWIKEFNNLLDQVEKSKGPACLVTVATGPKVYHTGFDLDKWKSDNLHQFESFALFGQLCARLMTFPVPTMTVVSGHAYAGGLILAMAHDFRTMRADYGFMCLSELNLDFPLPEQYCDMLKATLPPQTVREIMYGSRYNAQRSLQMQIVNQVYHDRQEMRKQITNFTNEFAPKGSFRESTRDLKTNMYRDVVNKLIQNPVSLQALRRVALMK